MQLKIKARGKKEGKGEISGGTIVSSNHSQYKILKDNLANSFTLGRDDYQTSMQGVVAILCSYKSSELRAFVKGNNDDGVIFAQDEEENKPVRKTCICITNVFNGKARQVNKGQSMCIWSEAMKIEGTSDCCITHNNCQNRSPRKKRHCHDGSAWSIFTCKCR